jgi:hypothetical protein
MLGWDVHKGLLFDCSREFERKSKTISHMSQSLRRRNGSQFFHLLSAAIHEVALLPRGFTGQATRADVALA